jgi:hypothetical protein
MSLASNALISLDDAKGYLELSDVNTFDSEVEDLVNALSDLFDVSTQRNLKASDITEYRDGDDSDSLWLRNYPVNETTSSLFLYIDFDREFGSEKLVAAADRIINPQTGKVTLVSSVFPSWPQSIKIVYNAGYATIPGDLRIALKVSLAYFWKQKKVAGVASMTSGAGGGSVTFIDDLPKTVQTILARYTRKW